MLSGFASLPKIFDLWAFCRFLVSVAKGRKELERLEVLKLWGL